LADSVDAATAARQQQAGCTAAQISLGDDRGFAASHDELNFFREPSMPETEDRTAAEPGVKLDYAGPRSESSSGLKRLWAEIAERVDGFLEFIGLITYYIGGLRRVGLAIGFACLAWGVGICLDRELLTDGPHWMCVGGFLVGLFLPLPAKRKLD
jgi:hypothetical protein